MLTFVNIIDIRPLTFALGIFTSNHKAVDLVWNDPNGKIKLHENTGAYINKTSYGAVTYRVLGKNLHASLFIVSGNDFFF